MREIMMKKIILATTIILASNQLMAKGLLSNFILTQGETYQCQVRLEVNRNQNQIFIRVGNSWNMSDGGVFQNNMIYSDINSGWMVTETSSAGQFSNNTELLRSDKQATLLSEEKLVSGGVAIRHTQQIFTVTDEQKATLEYKIITLKKKVSAPAYSNFKCTYKEEN